MNGQKERRMDIDEFDDYQDEIDEIDAMTDEELEAFEAYETRDYSPEEQEPVVFAAEKDEIDAAISKDRLNGYIDRKGETSAPEGSPLERYENVQVHTRMAAHPSVEYTEDTVRIDDRSVTGTFPEFSSVKDVQLPQDMRFARVNAQEKCCNEELCRDVTENPEAYRDVFTDRQMEQIRSHETPEGYTWHHHQEVGRMQLVDSRIHEANRHDGGFVLWGGEKR